MSKETEAFVRLFLNAALKAAPEERKRMLDGFARALVGKAALN